METPPGSVSPEEAARKFQEIKQMLADGNYVVPPPDQSLIDLEIRRSRIPSSTTLQEPNRRLGRHLRGERQQAKRRPHTARPGHIEDLLPAFDEDHARRVNKRHPDTF